MNAWDPWWVHGDYAETYHGAPDEEADDPPEVAFIDTRRCNMGVGCPETGICYAIAVGRPDMCGAL